MSLFSKLIKAKNIPSTLALELTSLDLTCSEDEGKLPTFTMLANTGIPMRLEGFFDPVIIDIKGFKTKQILPALKDHKTEVGHTTVIAVDKQKYQIKAEGILSVQNEDAKLIAQSSKSGFPWQASVGADIIKASFLDEGETAVVNGKEWEGPLIIAHKTMGKELTITKLGADSNTSVKVAAQRIHGENKMGFEAWLQSNYCEMLGIKASDISEDQLAKLRKKYEAELKAKSVDSVFTDPKDISKDTNLEAAKKRNELEAQREERMAQFDRICANYEGTQLNEIYLKETHKIESNSVRSLKAHAIRNDWTIDKFELECRKAEREDMGSYIISKSKPTFSKESAPAIACAIARNSGMPSSGRVNATGCTHLPPSMQSFREYGYEKAYKEDVLEASDQYSDWTLCMLLEQAYIQANGTRYSGRLGSDGFIKATRDAMWQIRAAGNTTWTGLDIFDDAANKLLWSAYQAQPSTWQQFVHKASVSDFKTSNIYRLSVDGGYKQVGADGQLKHGGFSDDKFTHSADTFGKIVGLSRKDIINDDLGALNRVMASLGVEGSRFLEELFYVQLLGQLTTIFPTNDANLNYISGAGTALGHDALTTAETKFMNQVYDEAPIGLMANNLLVGTNNSVLAAELYKKSKIDVLQTANAKGRTNDNMHVGKFNPIVSPYLNNTNVKQRIVLPAAQAIPGQSDNHWLLMPDPNSPQGAVIIGSFLNGNQRPTIQQGDQAFDVLGLQWRAYHDAGADNGDPKLALYSKGAA